MKTVSPHREHSFILAVSLCFFFGRTLPFSLAHFYLLYSCNIQFCLYDQHGVHTTELWSTKYFLSGVTTLLEIKGPASRPWSSGLRFFHLVYILQAPAFGLLRNWGLTANHQLLIKITHQHHLLHPLASQESGFYCSFLLLDHFPADPTALWVFGSLWPQIHALGFSLGFRLPLFLSLCLHPQLPWFSELFVSEPLGVMCFLETP